MPDEGEALLGFVDGRLVESRRAQDAPAPDDINRAVLYWLTLEEDERGSVETPSGEATYAAVTLAGPDGGQGLFVVANFPSFERAEIGEALRTQTVIALISLVVATVLGALLAGRVLRPLVTLAATARTISETDLSQRIPLRGRDEASLIAEAFNDMLTRLQGVFSAQRRFLDDTSHELRTPLTVIRGQVELLELDPTPQARAETTRVVLDEVDRVSRMVDDLFLLARADHPDFLRLEVLGVPAFMSELHRKLTTLAPLTSVVDVPDGLTVLADGHRLTQALMQLVSNATTYAGPDAAIEVGACVVVGDLVLSVTDDGRGISPQDALEIFERGRRGSGASSGGAGFGLAIVRAVAEGHGGIARLVSDQGRGARFELVIPLDVTSPAHARGRGTARS